MDLRSVLELKTAEVLRWSCDQNLGVWHPACIYNSDQIITIWDLPRGLPTSKSMGDPGIFLMITMICLRITAKKTLMKSVVIHLMTASPGNGNSSPICDT